MTSPVIYGAAYLLLIGAPQTGAGHLGPTIVPFCDHPAIAHPENHLTIRWRDDIVYRPHHRRHHQRHT